jgi:hypothetical protein
MTSLMQGVYMMVKLFFMERMKKNLDPPLIDENLFIAMSLRSKNALQSKPVAEKEVAITSYFLNIEIIAKKFRRLQYAHRFQTDGVSISLLYKSDAQVKKDKKKQDNAKQEAVKVRKMTLDQKKEYKEEKAVKNNENNKKRRLEENTNKNTKRKKKKREKVTKGGGDNGAADEFPLATYENQPPKHGMKVLVDPGKKNLFYCKEYGKDNFFRYTNKRRIFGTKQLVYERIRNKKKTGEVRRTEDELRKYNSKTCLWDDPERSFVNWCQKRVAANEILGPHYRQLVFRKLDFLSYKNRSREKTKMIKLFKEKFPLYPPGSKGVKTTLIMGNW